MLLIPIGVSAEEKPKKFFDIPTSIFIGASSADWVSTHQFLKCQCGITEGNPTIAWLEHKPAQMIALGAAIDGGGLLAWKYATRNHSKLQKIGLIAASSFRVYLAAKNFHLIQKHKRK